jgi:S-DNA-T family DNA segregation ATPase FtsK/SpoIIIE
MPPATQSYDSRYAQALMEDLNVPAHWAYKRAATALLFCALGAIILISVLTFSPFDNTADTAGLGGISNKLGGRGAALANIFMQLLGSASLVFGGLIFYSGVRRMIKPEGPQSRLARAGRAGIFSLAVMLSAATLSAFPIPQSWPMASGLGGWIGDGIYLNFKGALDHFNIPVSGLVVAFITFMSCAFALARYFRIVSKDLLDLWDAAGLVWATIRVWFDRLIAAIRRKFDATYGAEISSPDSLSAHFKDIPDQPVPAPAKKVRIKKPAVVAAAPPASS